VLYCSDMTTAVNTKRFPSKTHSSRWARLLGLSPQTLMRPRNEEGGILQGLGQRGLNNRIYYTKEEICKAFKLPMDSEED
jgi:hypothetical protein